MPHRSAYTLINGLHTRIFVVRRPSSRSLELYDTAKLIRKKLNTIAMLYGPHSRSDISFFPGAPVILC